MNENHLLCKLPPHREYPYGYLLSITRIEDSLVPSGYRLVFDEKIRVFADPALSISACKQSHACVLILGDVYSLNTNTSKSIAESLCRKLVESEFKFFSAVKHLWGRFLIAYYTHNLGPFAFTDATGMRSAFYSKNRKVIFSHPYMLGKHPADVIFKPKYGYPGNLTPIKDTFVLTPNTRITLFSCSISRFYPGLMEVDSGHLSASQAADLFINDCKKLLNDLASGNNLFVSLTGGLDSRVTLALILLCIPQYLDKIMFFTYRTKEKDVLDHDIVIASVLAKEFKLNHFVFSPSDYSDRSIEARILGATYYHSGPKLISGYRALVGANSGVHLRSNIYEIGRAFYSKKSYARGSTTNCTGKSVADLYLNSIRHAGGHCENHSELIRIFDRYLLDTNMSSACSLFDLRDVFYWEHRLGTWLPHIYLETDYIFKTLSLPNSWRFIEYFLSVCDEDRKQDALFRCILSSADSSLLDIPINPRDDASVSLLAEQIKSDIVLQVNNMALRSDENFDFLAKCKSLPRSINYKNNKICVSTEMMADSLYAFRLFRDRLLIEKRGYSDVSSFVFNATIDGASSEYSVRFYYKSNLYGVSVVQEAVAPIRAAKPPFNGDIVEHEIYPITYFRSLGLSHYFKRSRDSSALLVSFHGSIPTPSQPNPAFKLPCFRLYNLNIPSQPNLLCFSDLLLEELSEQGVGLAWFLDTRRHRQQERISQIVKYYINYYGLDEVIFHGSSGGGYPSLLMASYFNQTAIVSNSQFLLERHGQFPALTAAVSRQNDELLPFDLKSVLSGLPGPKKFISYCNAADYTLLHHDYANQLIAGLFPGSVEAIFFDGSWAAKERGVRNHSIGYPGGLEIQYIIADYLNGVPASGVTRENQPRPCRG